MISIIIPIYNTSKWLPQCIESCLSQTYTNFELILVNDASKDNSLSICQSYAEKDNRITIINKPINEGLEKARYSGYIIAKGEYIMHLDSDDWLNHINVLSSMYHKAEELQADYVEIGMQRVMDRHKWIRKPGINTITGLIEAPELFEKYYLSFFGVNILPVNIWGKLYRKSVLEQANIKPFGITMGEDLVFNIQLFPFLKRIYILEDIGYNYRFGGMTSKYNTRLFPDLKRLYCLKEELIEKHQYHKASDFIRIEMKNVLKSDICQRIIYKVSSKEGIIQGISQELEDPIYRRILHIENHPNVLKDPFVQAIANKDASRIYELCQMEVKRGRVTRIIKRILSEIFTRI